MDDMIHLTCSHCGKDFGIVDYFWDHAGDPVECPHCHSKFETDWDEGDDGVIGPWLGGPFVAGEVILGKILENE